MEKSKRLVSVLHGFSTIVFIFSLIVAALFFVGIIVTQFIDLPTLSSDLFSSRFVFDSAITIDVSFFDDANIRPIVNRLLITATFGSGFMAGLMYMLRMILKNVKEENVFVDQNSRLIKYIGYALIGFSIVMSSLRFWMANAIMNVVDLPNAHFGANFSFDFQMIFIGLIIIVLSHVFAYGTHLQQEYDATV